MSFALQGVRHPARSRGARRKWLDGLRRRPVLERLVQLQLLASVPLAFDDSNYYVAVNGTLNGTNLMANDWDPDGGTFSASVVANPTNGTITAFSQRCEVRSQ